MKRIIVLGAGGHGQVVADILLAMAQKANDLVVAGFLDDNPQLWDRTLLGLAVLGPPDALSKIAHDGVIVAIGDNKTRIRITSDLLARGECLVSAIHPHAVLGTDVQVGAGSMICAGVVVNAVTIIGQSVILNTGCTVDHHCMVGSYSHVAPGAHLGGEVTVGEGSLIGIGASILPCRRIEAQAIVGAGAVVIDDVPTACTVVGVPGRRVSGRTRVLRSPSSR